MSVTRDADPLQTRAATATLSEGDVRHGDGERAPTRGQLLGRYVLLDVIGRGGMGVVYLAYDPELDRRVALKLLGEGASETARARFTREAQAMARVTHPNVITVHDVGAVDDAVFVAMEYIDGEDLRSWLRAEERSWSEILEAFVAAGRGLAAAHEAGLVHRDFKPANVLRSHAGEIRVVDFGLARLAKGTGSQEPRDPELTDRSSVSTPLSVISSEVELTRTGALMGTPAYMAPEQHMRGEVDPRTDQFGFCVALYEALYGRRPFAGDNRMALMFETGRGIVPQPPKNSPVPSRLYHALRRGLQPEPGARWPSMNALLTELTEPRRTGRTRLLLVGLVAMVGIGAWAASSSDESAAQPCTGAKARLQDVWDQRQEQRVDAAFKATEVPYAEDASTYASSRLDAWARAWVGEHHEACAATAIRHEQSEALLDQRMLCLESQRRDVAALVEMLVDADAQAVERAAKAVASLPEPGECSDPRRLAPGTPLPDDEARRDAIADVQRLVSRARALEVGGRYQAGLEAATSAVEAAREIDYPPALARALEEYGVLLSSTGRKEDAVDALHEAAWTATLGRDDFILGRTWTKVVWYVGLDLSRYDDGLRWAQYARAALERSDAPPEDVADLEYNVGTVLWAAERLDEAEVALSKALELREAADPTSPLVAHSLTTIGNVQVQRGNPEAALKTFQRAKEIALAVHGPKHPLIATIDNAIGVALYRMHDLTGAAEAYERAYETMLASTGPDNPELLFSLGNIGNIRREQGRFAEALEALQRVEALVAKTYPPVHREAGMTAHNIAEVLLLMGRYDEALARFRTALEIREKVHGPDSHYVANTLTGLGETLLAMDRTDEALLYLERALRIREKNDEKGEDLARTRLALARVLATHRSPTDRDRARTLAEAARKGLEGVDGESATRQRKAIADVLQQLVP